MNPNIDFDAARQSISNALVATTRAVSSVAAEDIDFHRSADPAIVSQLDQRIARLLSLTESVLRKSSPPVDYTLVTLPDVDAVDAKWHRIVHAADSLFERADSYLDEYAGFVKPKGDGDHQQSSPSITRRGHLAQRHRPVDLPKPQLSFEEKPSNHETTPFRPLLSSKPHAIQPLEQSVNQSLSEDGVPQAQHPYQVEIRRCGYPNRVYQVSTPRNYAPFASTRATLVEDMDGVHSMLENLKDETEIAIDVEHHDTHSFVGLVSLMQISTSDHDWIIDTLKPWRRRLEVLNEVFANPQIVKVLHGAQLDIVWLQRDLGLYIVGLFDTYHAAHLLGYPRKSLAFLLKKFINFDAQKQFQLADWRMRPLPEDMLDYARSDTHFLLHIYDRMRNELVERSESRDGASDLVLEVLSRSKETALQRYEHSFYDNRLGSRRSGWFPLLSKHPANMTQEQIAVFSKVHEWRDKVARDEDESPNHVLSLHALFNLSRSLPKEKAAVLGAAHPLSPFLRSRGDELTRIIRDALESAQHGPSMADIFAHLPIRGKVEDRPAAVEVVPAASSQPRGDVDIRALTSAFWGDVLSVFGHTNHMTKNRFARVYHLLFPSGMSPPETADVMPNVSSIPKSTIPGDTTFTARDDQSRKRKADTVNGNNDRDTDDESDGMAEKNDARAETEDKSSDTVQKRLKRKAAKKAKRLPTTDPDGTMLQPVDYENTPSVLHSKSIRDVQKGSSAATNPFAKSMNAPPGLPRTQGSNVGKSMTFNS